MQMLVWRKNLEDIKCPTLGLLQPRTLLLLLRTLLLLLLLISNVKPIEKYLALEPRTLNASYTVHSQGKLTTPRRKNRKTQYDNVFLKANEHAPYVYIYKLQIYRMTPKTYHKIS
jgi:hypothetical protein